jgi:hypothetical protein
MRHKLRDRHWRKRSSALILAVFFVEINLALEQKIAVLSPLIDAPDRKMRAVEIKNLLVIFHVQSFLFAGRKYHEASVSNRSNSAGKV